MPPRTRKKPIEAPPPLEAIPEPLLSAVPPAAPPAAPPVPVVKKPAATRKKKAAAPAPTPQAPPEQIENTENIEHVEHIDVHASHDADEDAIRDADAPHIILQLPISADRIQDIVSKMEGANDGRGDPSPYVPNHYWTMSCSSFAGGVGGNAAQDENAPENPTLCHWCCHAITANKFGMPVDYDSIHNIFHVYGQFCSLSCAAAHNVSTHMGSDRMWDVHGWLQMMAQVYQLPLPVRPSPSRYVLKMFGGPLSIEEFRAAHSTLARTVVLNVPPLVSVQPQVEWVNTSFLAGSGNGLNVQRLDGVQRDGTLGGLGGGEGTGAAELVQTKMLTRRKSVVDSKRTLESKMNLTVSMA